jgi:plastocyanin
MQPMSLFEARLKPRPILLSAMVALAVSAAACGGGSQPSSESAAPSAPAATPSGQKVDESKAGAVTGKIVLEGASPKAEPIKMSADPICVRENKAGAFSEAFMVKDGALANVFVYVKDGLGNYVYDTPTTALKLDQDGCRYHPHVFGIRVGQPLEIVNSDPTLHNIHATPKVNTEFNTGQPIEGMKSTHTFTAKEVMVPFKCDVHGWMNAYAGVLDHPYFAVTGEAGTFELKSLPAGTYTIEAWHERLGPQTQSVTIGEKESKEITFTFKMT